ncbi:hypothetical protein LNKW23_24010 [Paralimibaculum aggregatum]|uniref:Peptidoglycan binding-like domain-containing protein n=1 Tax=Paralimibaculum aggregatum TaxID=3036245 RepID=A0ABQ6LPF8_9RHOB|nr:peptidoglycan-binding protein [Limibaculum sp. NKW23]GMG83188.1 hypothetical protein LNKW23_24010 [Limibaculum sp. NKW23]
MANLKRGDQGNEVKDLQKKLNAVPKLGVKLVVDGIFGPKTEAAVKKFQKHVEVKITGVYDAETRKRLEAGGEPPPKMTVEDYKSRLEKNQKVLENNRKGFEDRSRELAAAQKTLQELLARAKAAQDTVAKLINENKAYFTEWLAIAQKIAANQKTFETLAKTNPAKARELLKTIEADHKQAEKVLDRLRKNQQAMIDADKDVKKVIDAVS